MKTILKVVAGSLLLIASGCSSQDPDTIRTVAMQESFAGLGKCTQISNAEPISNLALVSATNAPNETALKLVVYATNTPIEFPLAAYKLSAGRWLIGENERAFLMDEHCREFKLRDRRRANGEKFPMDGFVRLKPRESFEMTFSFYRINDASRFGMLVYGGKTLPFVVNSPETQR